MKIVSLFSGIGGLEYGFSSKKHDVLMFCENDPAAKAVLRARHPSVKLVDDVTTLTSIPQCDLVTAGFPCQDLSQAGAKVGIKGGRSGLVNDLFRLLRNAKPKPEWLLVENVPFMLHLDKGHAMEVLTKNVEELGYSWCYRTVEGRSFGLPQRRPRVLFLASLNHDPRDIILSQDKPALNLDGKPSDIDMSKIYGFYWTEGSRGVGWAGDSVPPIKGGSTIGIPSPPAVWLPKSDFVGTISINDAERLQGFRKDWTAAVEKVAGIRSSSRWRLVGNAVNTRLSKWIASRFDANGKYDCSFDVEKKKGSWPKAAWGHNGKVYISKVSMYPCHRKMINLSDFLNDPLKPLSIRATSGFLSRTKVCTNVNYSKQFIESLEKHLEAQK